MSIIYIKFQLTWTIVSLAAAVIGSSALLIAIAHQAYQYRHCLGLVRMNDWVHCDYYYVPVHPCLHPCIPVLVINHCVPACHQLRNHYWSLLAVLVRSSWMKMTAAPATSHGFILCTIGCIISNCLSYCRAQFTIAICHIHCVWQRTFIASNREKNNFYQSIIDFQSPVLTEGVLHITSVASKYEMWVKLTVSHIFLFSFM